MTETPILWEETVQAGASWSHVLKRGTALRITDLEGGANVGALFYNFECPVERYNMPDTLKAQHIARLTEGFVLYSDMGRILCSVTGDTVGWHDPLGGCSNAAAGAREIRRRALPGDRNDCHQNAHDSFLVELGKWGLGPRDLVPNVNFFSRVTVGEDGGMQFRAGQFAARRLRRTARRDEHADDPQHLPASARPQPEVRAQAGAALHPARAGRRPPTIRAASRARKTAAASR